MTKSKNREFRVTFIVEVPASKLPNDRSDAAYLVADKATNEWDAGRDDARDKFFADSYDFEAEEL